MSKYRSLQETDHGQYSGPVSTENSHHRRATKNSSSKDKVRLCAFVGHLCFLKSFYSETLKKGI